MEAARAYDKIVRESSGSVRSCSAAVREANNLTKRMLITTYAGDAVKVLDFCCGRGGDLPKWSHVRSMRHYTGLDVSSDSIAEARRRAGYLMRGGGGGGRKIDFIVCDVSRTSDHIKEATLYDCVSAQFCLHYFMRDQEVFRVVMRKIRQWLRPGGKLLVTTVDKEAVEAFFEEQETGGVAHPFVRILDLQRVSAHRGQDGKVADDGHQGGEEAGGRGGCWNSIAYRFCMDECVDADLLEYSVGEEQWLATAAAEGLSCIVAQGRCTGGQGDENAQQVLRLYKWYVLS
jgi:SAM-dependent methyltransferase